MDNFNQLPPPPQGQTGISPDRFAHLPPPPQGQIGKTLTQINSSSDQNQPASQMPILTNQSGGFGTALKDVAVGFGKGLLNTARDTASSIQNLGKGFLKSGFGIDSSNMGFQSVDNSTPSGSQVGNQLQSKSRGEQAGNVLSTATQLLSPLAGGNAEALLAKGKSAYEGYKVAQETKAATDASSKITEMISPKPTIKEARLATTQGRFVEGKNPTLFRAGTEDTIAPSQKTLSASQTIQKNIPGASKMSPSELYTAVDKNISDTATKLRPQMKATPIKPETVEKLNTDWETLKKTQMADAPATEEANVAKRQAKFQSLLEKSGNSSHADLWDTAIKYDDSIPENVKKATSLSPESQQLQKQEWLDNRQILSDAMEKSSRPEFKAMSDMYNAKTGLLSKAKVDGAQMSQINQFLKDNPKTAKVLGGATIYEVAKHLGLPLP